MALIVGAMLTACASPIVTKVTSFNQWPADAAGASFSFVAPPGKPVTAELAQATYETHVQRELEKQGFRRAPSSQAARLLVELSTATQTQQRTYLQPVYREPPMVFVPGYRNAAGQIFPGYWAPSLHGPIHVGDRVVPYTVQFNQLGLRMLDTQGSPPGRPRTVFESTAVYEGGAELPLIAPYLARAALDGFPGQNGQVRTVKFDRETGAVIKK